MAANINLKIKSDFEQASKDYREFIDLNEDAAKRAKQFQDSFDTKQINKFLSSNKRTAAAVKATSGELQAQRVEQSKLRKQIESLIKKGMDPLDDRLKPLTDRYQKLEKEIEDSTQAANGNQKAFSLVDGVMLGLGTKALDLAQEGFQQLVQFTKDSAQAASEAQEVYSKFSVVFGGVEDSARSAAQSLAEDFDLASSTAQKLLGDTGDLLTGFGLTEEAALELSEETNRLAIDLASFTNAQGGAEAVSRALTSAYSGEREALKTYGIVINEASVQARMLKNEQEGLTFETEQQAEAAATLQLAQEQSKNAIGDYARTSESAANVQRRLGEQTKRLQENYGEFVQQGLTPVRSALAGMLSQLNDTIERSREMREAINAFKEEGAAAAEAMSIEDINHQIEIQTESLEELEEKHRQTRIDYSEEIQVKRNLVDALMEERASRAQLLRFAAMEEEQLSQNQKQQKKNAEAAAETAEMNREAWQERLKIQEEFNRAQMSEEERVIAEINAKREKRLEEAAENHVLTGKEIAMINKIYDDQITAYKQEQEEKRREIYDESTERLRGEIEERRRAEIDAAIQQFEKYKDIVGQKEQASIDSFMQTAEAAKQAGVEEAEVQRWLTDRIIEYRAQQVQAAADAANEIMGIFSAIDQLRDAQAQAELQRMEQQGASEEELAQKKKEIARENAQRERDLALFQVAVDTAAAIIGFLADPGGLAGVALASTAAVTGAIQAAAINSEPLPTAQTGGQFEIPRSQSTRQDNVGVRAQEGETVTVTPRGESATRQHISVSLDGEVMLRFINDKIESGEIRITADNIQGGISV